MVRRNGRASEARLALKLVLKTNALRLFAMSRLGGKLMRTKRFSLRSEKML